MASSPSRMYLSHPRKPKRKALLQLQVTSAASKSSWLSYRQAEYWLLPWPVNAWLWSC